MHNDEPSLVIRAQKGDGRALATLLTRYENPLYASALAIVGSSWDALDVLQETMLEACGKITALRDARKLRSWLTTILLRKCYDRLRDQKKYELRDEFPDTPAHLPVAEERDEELLQALRGLIDEQRTVLALRFFLDLSYEQIAELTGAPLGTVKSRIHRGLAALRETVVQELSEQ